MKYYYPVIFEYDEDVKAYGMVVPDIPGCISQGRNMEEAISMVQEAMGLMLEDYSPNRYPTPSNPKDIPLEENQFISVVEFDQLAYDKKYNSKATKKTLSIPAWLNDAAMARNINFSNVLKNALMRELNIA